MGGATCAGCRRSRSTPPARATTMTRSRRRCSSDGSWRVWVHIADVSAYVAPRSSVDREAYRRATSVYVPGAVEPMLPGTLSNDVCSLVQGQDRLTVTVEMTVVADGSGRPLVDAPIADPLGRPARLRPGRSDLRRVRASRGIRGPSRSPPREPRRPRSGSARERQAAVVLDSPEPDFTLRPRRATSPAPSSSRRPSPTA